jgi:nanoRNase/pAp phosphatase (c-di-AMP/oligoRNAs hydrolase)
MTSAFISEGLEGLLALAAQRERAVVVTHDFPDPDGMAAAAGLGFLLQERAGLSARVAYGGIIGRAENQAVVRLLKLPAVPLRRVSLRAGDLVALVDTQPGFGNHSLPDDQPVDVVVDHHLPLEGEPTAAVPLLSTVYGATSSIVTELLRAAALEPPVELATALFYGVKTDTRSLSREADEADRAAYEWLYPRRDPALLARIEHPIVPRPYFEAFHRAFERARLYDTVVVADIGDVYVPDIVPEVAERLMSLEGARWSIALGVWDSVLFISVRTVDGRVNAGKRIRRALEGLGGSAGGHGKMAGAQLPLGELPYREARRLVGEVVDRIKDELGVGERPPEPLIDNVHATTLARQGGAK